MIKKAKFKHHRAVFAGCALLLWISSVQGAPFKGQRIVVSGPSPYLSSIVKTIHQSGGNIIDAATACALSLTVTHPYYVSLGAGGFALIKKKGKVWAIDFREKAPQNMKPDFYVTQGLSSQTGGAAVGVPGFLAGLWSLHKKHGKLSWPRLVTPALQLAKKGFPVSGNWSEITLKKKKNFNSTGQLVFLRKKTTYLPGDTFKYAKMVKALKLVQKSPLKSFYGGPLGRDVVSTVIKNKGVMTVEDLKSYQVRWLEPVTVSFRGHQVYSMPLPSSGGLILARALNLIEKQKLHEKPLYSVEELHLLGEILARAFRPRNLMGDPNNFEGSLPNWLSEENLKELNRTLSPTRVHHLNPLKEPMETTHISLMNNKGEAVAMTLTLNGFYGSGLVTEKYGIVLNNQMDDFTTLSGKANMYGVIQGRKNQVKGGRTPLSSMTPVIVEHKGKTILALGGAGGPMIISGVLQTLYRYIANGLNIDQAIQAPRIHHQFIPRHLFVEEKRFNPDVILQLKMKGHKVHHRDHIARVFGVALDRKNGWLSAGHETRREGFAGGY